MQYLAVAKYGLMITAFLLYSWLCYELGKSNKEVQIKTKEVEVIREVIKYEKQTMSKIISKPNLADDDISQLFNEGKL
ncbi:MAG: hypothetical protein ACK5N8_02350 [Alphaproteobacteria bacterium]